MSERADKASVARGMIAVHNEDPHVLLERFEEFFHPECEWVPVIVGSLEGNKYRGKEGFRRWYAERNDALDEASVDIESCEEVREDVVLLLGRSLARGRASGARVNEEVGVVFQFRDGLIWHDQAFRSHRDAREAVASA